MKHERQQPDVESATMFIEAIKALTNKPEEVTRMHTYAVKYLDSSGYTTGYGYIETCTAYKRGEIIHNTQPATMIDYETDRASALKDMAISQIQYLLSAGYYYMNGKAYAPDRLK